MSHRQFYFGLLLCLSAVFFGPTPGIAQSSQIPLTQYGHPDLQGVWNFSTTTPLERPERYGSREFLTDREVAEQSERRRRQEMATAERAATPQRISTPTAGTNAGSVNSFWMERTGLQENPRTSVIIHPGNGRIPEIRPGILIQRSDQNGVVEIPGVRPVRYTHGGIARNGPEDRGLSERCMVFNSGPPLLSGPYNNNIQIIQNQDHVVILAEMGFDARIVPVDGRPHAPAEVTQWSGDSRGFFEGSTLVIETRNFNNQIASLSLRDRAFGSGENRLLIERFSVTGPGTMDYEFTIEDPVTFKDKLVGVIPMTRTNGRLYEYACHAGNYAIANILKGGRATDSRQ